MALGAYQPSVRIGNWHEDLCLEEDIIRSFLHKKEQGTLCIQQSINLQEMYERRISTSVTTDGYVHYNDVVMLKVMGSPPDAVIGSGEVDRKDCVLALQAPAEIMYKVKKIDFECGVSGCTKCYPQPRTTFRIVPTEVGTSSDAPIRFGDLFMLMPLAGEGLYLNCNMKTFRHFSLKARHHQVNLVPYTSTGTIWRFLHYDPRLRFEYEGIPVPANEKLVINHMKTNEALAVEDLYSFRTPFGREYEISVHTYLDCHRVEREFNHWIVAMGTPEEKTPMDAAAREARKSSASDKDTGAGGKEGSEKPVLPETTYKDHYSHPDERKIKELNIAVLKSPVPPISTNYIFHSPKVRTPEEKYETLPINPIPESCVVTTTAYINPQPPSAQLVSTASPATPIWYDSTGLVPPMMSTDLANAPVTHRVTNVFNEPPPPPPPMPPQPNLTKLDASNPAAEDESRKTTVRFATETQCKDCDATDVNMCCKNG